MRRTGLPIAIGITATAGVAALVTQSNLVNAEGAETLLMLALFGVAGLLGSALTYLVARFLRRSRPKAGPILITAPLTGAVSGAIMGLFTTLALRSLSLETELVSQIVFLLAYAATWSYLVHSALQEAPEANL